MKKRDDLDMANLQNLRPWPKGVSGNPAGRPRQTKLTAALRELLGKVDPEDKAGRTYAEVIADKMIRRAARGDVRAAREIRVMTEGRAPCGDLKRRIPGLRSALGDRLFAPVVDHACLSPELGPSRSDNTNFIVGIITVPK